MIHVRTYTGDDLTRIEQWYRDRGLVAPDPSILSSRGYIVDECSAGWLYTTDSCLGLIDGIISDPKVGKTKRERSLHLLHFILIQKAREAGFTHLMGVVNHPSIHEIAKEYEAEVLPHSVYTLKLKD